MFQNCHQCNPKYRWFGTNIREVQCVTTLTGEYFLMVLCFIGRTCKLTHRCLKQTANMLQTTFSIAFPRWKASNFDIFSSKFPRFQSAKSIMVQLMEWRRTSKNTLIKPIWIDIWRHMVSLGHNEILPYYVFGNLSGRNTEMEWVFCVYSIFQYKS